MKPGGQPVPPPENPQMRDLRSAHAEHHAVMRSLKHQRDILAKAKVEGVDLDGMTHAIHILEAVDEQIASAYGRMALERDLPSLRER